MKNRLLWIDLEMTGLNPERHVILEIASMVTDENLTILAEGPDLAIQYPEETLGLMDEWSRRQHEASGLLERAGSSSVDCSEAERQTLDFLSLFSAKGHSPLCGNSVWQDRRFLLKYMPRLESFFHYRNIDVSSIKELVKRWYPSAAPFKKTKDHLALSDIKESILELRYYREEFFVRNPSP